MTVLSTADYVKWHGLDALLGVVPTCDQTGVYAACDPAMVVPYLPDWDDLVRLHRLVLSRRVTTVLEFGCGYSTIVMAHALAINEREHGAYVRANLRRSNAFEVHAVDDMQTYIDQTLDRLPASLAGHAVVHHSQARMTTFADRICTEYDRLPNVCPDMIYLDGPSQHSVLGRVNGITTAHLDRLPMACDVLRMEWFLLPGTIIVVDGRTTNARFLEANFQRAWRTRLDAAADVTAFDLIEEPIGKLNEKQIRYCLGDEWLQHTRIRGI